MEYVLHSLFFAFRWKPSHSVPLFYSTTCSIYQPKGPHPPPSPATWCFVQIPIPAHRSVLAARLKILGTPDLDGSYGRWDSQTSWESRRARASSRVCLRRELAWGEDTETYYDNLGVLYLAYCCRTRSSAFLSKRRRRWYASCEEFIDFANKYRLMLKLIRMAFGCVSQNLKSYNSFWSLINCGRM